MSLASSLHRRHRSAHASRRGTILVITVVLLGALMVITAAFLRLGVGLSHEHNADLDNTRAFYLAEAAVSESAAAILSGKTGNVASQVAPASYANGIVWAVATNLGGNDYQIDSTALCDSGRVAVRAVVHKDYRIDYTKGVSSDLPLVVGSNFLMDSYDPALGSYVSQPKKKLPGHNDLIVDDKGSVASNSNITLNSGDHIYGDATPGPGSSVFGIGGNTFVTGSTAPALRTIGFPQVTPPALPSLGVKTVNKADPIASRTLTSGSYHFTSLDLKSQAAFTIQGPSTVVIDSLTTAAGCSLAIDATNGPVNVYFTGSTSFVSNMNITSTAPSAKSISLFFTSNQPVILNPNASLLGTIYAATATVTVSSNWHNFGAITAKQVVVASNVQLHFDESLLTQGRQGGMYLVVKQWQRMPVPQSMIEKRVDPYQLLGVARGSLPQASNAYQ
jgi:hypothetical protein